jgi:hypothetical protein
LVTASETEAMALPDVLPFFELLVASSKQTLGNYSDTV